MHDRIEIDQSKISYRDRITIVQKIVLQNPQIAHAKWPPEKQVSPITCSSTTRSSIADRIHYFN